MISLNTEHRAFPWVQRKKATAKLPLKLFKIGIAYCSQQRPVRIRVQNLLGFHQTQSVHSPRLHSVHSRAARITFNLDRSLSDVECLLKTHWPSISYFYKKSVIIFMHKFYFHSLSFLPEELFSKKLSSRSSRAGNQMIIPRPRSGLGDIPCTEDLLYGTFETQLSIFQAVYY